MKLKEWIKPYIEGASMIFGWVSYRSPMLTLTNEEALRIDRMVVTNDIANAARKELGRIESGNIAQRSLLGSYRRQFTDDEIRSGLEVQELIRHERRLKKELKEIERRSAHKR